MPLPPRRPQLNHFREVLPPRPLLSLSFASLVSKAPEECGTDLMEHCKARQARGSFLIYAVFHVIFTEFNRVDISVNI